jgi:ATP-dependent helicase/nuclease subunit B
MADGGGRVRFRDFAVIARDLEPFADLVAEVFDAYGIPCFLDRRRPMAVHPLCRFVASLLEAVRDDLPPRAMGRLLRTGLTPLRRRDAERLENLLLRLEFRGARNWGRPTWDPGETLPARLESMSRPRRSPDQDGEARSGLRSREIDVKRLELLAAIEPLLTLANADPHSTAARASVRQPSTVGRASARQPSTVGRASVPAANGRMWADAILTALRKLRVPRRLEAWIRRAQRERDWETAETHRLAWDSLCNLLDDLHDVLGDVPVTIDELQQTLSAALSELTLGLAPPTLDQVLVSSIERSRHPEIRHAWVFAFNEGVFPAPPAEDVLLSTAERRRVAETGLAAPAAHRDDVFGERLLAYIAFSRPSESLTISFATADDEGGALQPSLLLDEVRGALPGIQVQRPEPFAPPVCVEELANDYLDARGADVIDPRVPARHRRLIARTRENLHLQPRLEWLLRGERYDNRPTPLRDPTPQEGRSETGPTAELAQDQPETGPPVAWSTYPSEIETYVQCPFKHFATHRLRLDRRTPLPMLWEMGNVAHDLLAEVFRTASATGRLRDLSDEEWKALIGESVRRFDAIQPDDLAERNPRMAFMIRSTQRFVAEVAMAHVHRLRRSEFQPAGFELYFGPPRPAFDTGSSGADAVADQQAPSLPPLRLAVPDGRVVEVRGKIDRVDRCRVGGQDLLLIYDYKTFAATMNLDFLTQHRLALFLYMLAQRESGAGRVVGGLIAPWRPEIKNLEADYVAAAPAAEQLMYLYRPRGALEQAVAERLDTQLAPGPHSPVAMVKLNKDGDFAKQGDTHPGKKIAAGIELARATLLQVAGGVLSGRIEPSPLVENDRLACSMCDCKPLCRFERAGNDLRDPMSDLPTHAKLQHGGRS